MHTHHNGRRVILHLSLISGVGPATILRLCSGLYTINPHEHNRADLLVAIKNDAAHKLGQLYSYSSQEFKSFFGCSETLSQQLVVGLADTKLIDEECRLLEKSAISWVTFFDDDYPLLLQHIHQPPAVIYVKGKPLSSYSKTIAIVGSRDADVYAKQSLDLFIPALAEQGWAVVSGGARGVDTWAHERARANNAKTIVVLGSGLLKPYPAENKKLFDALVDSGAGSLVSPFPLNASPDRHNFPARNRIIAGLSQGCLVVQAAAKSGALITAQYALEQGRSVFAIPGSIFNPLSAGCHNLLAGGAKLVAKPDDLLEEFGEIINKASAEIAVQKSLVNESVDPIIEALVRPMSLDELCCEVALAFEDMQDRLFNLQLEGKVTQNSAGLWERIL